MTSTISASAQRELQRRTRLTLAVLRHVLEASGRVAATCRYYGLSHQAYYKWFKCHESEGFDGLNDRSSTPTIHRPRPAPK